MLVFTSSTKTQARASMAELVLSTVNKIYHSRRKKAVHAVNNLDLTVKNGEIVALLGSSGCGKTSTLRMIAGFEDVSSGVITLGSRAIHTLPPSARNVAMAFEAYSLYPPLTIGDNMAFALKAAKLPASEAEDKVKAMADMLEISGILDKYPSSVSGGQQQRASLGRALVRKADLYLLDEPMGQLEPQLRAILRGRIKHYLRQNNCTSILVTHDQTEANALADRIAVMEAGELQQYASPAELKAAPANLFTGTFIGEPPMNVFNATVARSGKTFALDIGGGNALSYSERELAAPIAKLLSDRAKVTIGARPHAVRVGKGSIKGKIASCQWLGDQTHIAVDVGGRTVVSVAHDRMSQKIGDEANLDIAPGDLHLFDPDSGHALSHGDALA
jgi:multiple sugar transport system ATP-binding protein